jgi:phage shock protein PspC (stress-responsive transcriptional regulator)
MKKVYISETDKKIFGIFGGIGQAYDIDPTLLRITAVFLCLLTGIVPLVVTYLAAWLITPEKPAEKQ